MKNKFVIINKLKKIALKSNLRCKHAAAVVNKGKIISYGYNHIKLNHKSLSIHAERHALSKCNKKDINGSILIVIRLDYTHNLTKNNLLLSKPCINCKQFIDKYIKKYNLKKVYYSINKYHQISEAVI